jgi:hypothetical protein
MAKNSKKTRDISDDVPHRASDIIEKPVSPIKSFPIPDATSQTSKVEIATVHEIKPQESSKSNETPKSKDSKVNKLIMLVVAVLIIGIASITWHNHQKKITKVNNPCSDALLKEAAANFDGKKLAALEKIVAQIKSIPNYQRDPNCMYVLTSYYITSSDPANASKSFGLLKQDYKPTPGFSPILQTNSTTMSTLESEIIALEGNQTGTTNNAYGVDAQGQIQQLGSSQ